MKNEIDKLLDELKISKIEISATSEINITEPIIINSEDLFESVKNYSDICTILKESKETCPYKQIKQIEKLFNGDWKKDWTDHNQYKYFPYFEHKASDGWVFIVSSAPGPWSFGQVAYFKDSKTSDFVGRTFIDIYLKIIE